MEMGKRIAIIILSQRVNKQEMGFLVAAILLKMRTDSPEFYPDIKCLYLAAQAAQKTGAVLDVKYDQERSAHELSFALPDGTVVTLPSSGKSVSVSGDEQAIRQLCQEILAKIGDLSVQIIETRLLSEFIQQPEEAVSIT